MDYISGTAVLEFGPAETLSPIDAVSPAYPCLCRPRRVPRPAHPREKPGFSPWWTSTITETRCSRLGWWPTAFLMSHLSSSISGSRVRRSIAPNEAPGRHQNRNRKFVDSPLEGDGFEPVWGFSCQAFVFGFCRFFVRSGKPFFVPSPAIGFAERAEGAKGPKR